MAGGVIASPIGVLHHELGRSTDPDQVLHFASAGWGDEGQFDTLWRAGAVGVRPRLLYHTSPYRL